MRHKFYILFILLFGVADVFSQGGIPTPGDGGPSSPPGFPIDENIFGLMIVALLLGFYIIYRHNRIKTKTPI
jgi:hypothetical protein